MSSSSIYQLCCDNLRERKRLSELDRIKKCSMTDYKGVCERLYSIYGETYGASKSLYKHLNYKMANFNSILMKQIKAGTCTPA